MIELEGKTLGRYELRRRIGKGGMANVYEAFDMVSGQTLALKVFKREDDELLRRFLREARVMASLHGHHLVPIYDSGTYDLDNVLHYYIAMPFMRGGTLRTRIRRESLTLDEACRALQEIADALDYVHSQGIIHRDIKASNVLIDDNGSYYLTDFGIARIAGDMTHLTTTGNVLGTVDYVAPELFEVDRRADAYSDLYSLGVLLYEMVTGRLPFIAENQIALVTMHMRHNPPAPRDLNFSISDQVERVMLKALEKRPERRYHSATELAEAFCGALSAESAKATPEVPVSIAPGSVTPAYQPGQLILSPVPVGDASIPAWPLSESEMLRSAQHDIRGDASIPAWPLPESEMLRSAQHDIRGDAGASAQPLSVSPPKSRPIYRRPLFALVVVLLAFVIIAGSISVLFLPHAGSGATPNSGAGTTATGASTKLRSISAANLTATAIAAQNATATARAQATAAAFARMTATAQAQASATAGVIATVTSGQPVYQDALNDPNNPATISAGWDASDDCTFKKDGYHDTTTSSLQGCKEANNTYMDAAITVDMSIVSGQAGGLFFRMGAPVYLFGGYLGYLFEVDSIGRYRVLSSGDFNAGAPTILQDWTPSNALHKGSTTNTLQLIMRGSDFFFYANGIFLIHLNDSGYSSGQVAFLARSDGTTPADVVYSNLAVYTLG